MHFFKPMLVLVVMASVGNGLGGASPATGPATVKIERLWTTFRDAQSFLRLHEYRTGEEASGDAVILRSQPAVRDGLYYTMRVTADGPAGTLLPDATVVLQIVAPDAAQPRTFSFPFSASGRRSVHLEVGLTGTDWPHGETLPLAWKFDVVGSAGQVLASRQSFLWEKPAAPQP